MAKNTSISKKKKKRTYKKKKSYSKPERKTVETPPLEDAPEDILPLRDDPFVEEHPSKLADHELLEKFPPPPGKTGIFVARWKEFLPDIMKRDNFKRGHLSQLSILCDLYVEYAKLHVDIQKRGYTYISIGRNGKQERPRPEVQQMNKTRIEIRNYSKALGLVLVKDKETGNGKGKDTWE